MRKKRLTAQPHFFLTVRSVNSVTDPPRRSSGITSKMTSATTRQMGARAPLRDRECTDHDDEKHNGQNDHVYAVSEYRADD